MKQHPQTPKKPQHKKNAYKPRYVKPKKPVGPIIVIAIILVLAGIGVGIYLLSNSGEKPTRTSKNSVKVQVPKFVGQPVNQELKEATLKYGNIIYGGFPICASDTVNILQNTAYYSAYSEKRRNPLWVAYRLDCATGTNQLHRPGGFAPDNRTKARIRSKIYKNTGYDRGHMCPNSAIALRYGRKAQLETFVMSNVVPQKPALNRHVWERLERLEEAYSNKYENVWVITGPIFDDHIELMKKQVEIPDAFFKILLDEQDNKVRALAFILPQDVTGKESLTDFLTSIDEIERRTGLNFLEPMTDLYEDKLEAEITSMWVD